MANIVGEYANIQRAETGFWSLDKAMSGNGHLGIPMTFVELFGFQGIGKCLGKGTKVLMYDGELKSVENLRNGDRLMGVDSTPRTVMGLAHGTDMMYWVRQNKGVDYRVNSYHVLSLKFSGHHNGWGEDGEIQNVSIRDILTSKPKTFLSRWMGYKVPVDFSVRSLDIDPYFLGLWLGDGNSDNVGITNIDPEVIEFLHEYAHKLGATVHVTKQPVDKTPRYSITNAYGESLQSKLRGMKVLGNKHIPKNYLINSIDTRRKVLAGLIDSDGYYGKQANTYTITLKSLTLISDIKFLCDSLGLRTGKGITEVWKSPFKHQVKSKYYTLNITGDLSDVPLRVPRKVQTSSSVRVDKSRTGIKIEPDGIGDYYGFTLDGDGLFLLEDMTVTHNTTLANSLMAIIANKYQKNIVYAPFEHVDRELMSNILDSLECTQEVSMLGRKDMVKRFFPSLKVDKVTDEVILDCFIEAVRHDEYCVGVIDSLSTIVTIAEAESSVADRNMGRARVVSAFARAVLQAMRMRELESPFCALVLSHKTSPMGGGTPTNTGAPTTGGEVKKNVSKVRIGIRRIPEPAFAMDSKKSLYEEQAYILEGKVEKNNFGREGKIFYVAMLGGKGAHVGLTAMYECRQTGLATFGKTITLGSNKYGSIASALEKAHAGDDQFFEPFIQALKNPSSVGKAKADEDEIPEIYDGEDAE